jgi:hypothetical protein
VQFSHQPYRPWSSRFERVLDLVHPPLDGDGQGELLFPV